MHCESLTRSCLTIGKDCSIVALKAGVCDRPRYILKQCRLFAILLCNVIVGECLGIHSTVKNQFDSIFDSKAQFDLICWPSSFFSLIDWSDSNDNLDIVLLGSGAQCSDTLSSSCSLFTARCADLTYARCWFKLRWLIVWQKRCHHILPLTSWWSR